LFVSVHSNYYGDPNTRGAMVLYYDDNYPQSKYPASEAMKRLTPQSKDLAQKVLDAVVAATNTDNKGLMQSAAYVIRSGEAPSILVETAFLSNKQDEALLSRPAVRQKFAEGIARGIVAFMPPAKDEEKAEAAPFGDLVGHWAEQAIRPLLASGLMNGMTPARFEPDQPLTRAQLLAVLDRLFPVVSPAGAQVAVGQTAGHGSAGQGANGQPAVKRRVPLDLDSGHWAYPVLMKALSAGRIEGYADGTLRPDQPVTRAEASALFYRSLAANGSIKNANATAVAAFDDVPTNAWSAGAIYALRQLGLAEGVTATSFGPSQRMTRAEIAVLIERYLQSVKPKSS
jgi:N-acetylmuramoyl-L-alanine amidase